MPALARGQENTTSIINWFITVAGTLTDAYSVEYRIFDISGGLPGTQIFPAIPGVYEDVTAAPGKFSTGSYYAYDNVEGKGFTPELTATIGTHRIEWRWKISETAPYQAGQEDFEVLHQSAGGSTDTYISIADIRAEGLAEADYSNTKVLAYIETWQAFLERATRQWFVPRALILEVDGTNSDALHFGVPIISIDYIRINGDTTDLDESQYKVYSENSYPDNRRNPRIKLVQGWETSNIYTRSSPNGRLLFRKGRKNQVIKGTFGFVESDGSVPKPIKRALTLLVIEKLTNPAYGTPDPDVPPLLGNLLEEWTDGHRMKYGAVGGETDKRKPGLSGITSNPEILDIIKLYRAPIGVATPAHPNYG